MEYSYQRPETKEEKEKRIKEENMAIKIMENNESIMKNHTKVYLKAMGLSPVEFSTM